MHPFLLDAKNLILDTLFPVHCLICNREGVFLCPVCSLCLKRSEHQCCIVCGKPSLLGLTHPKCFSAHQPDGSISFLDYHDKNLSRVLITGKYSFLPGVFDILGVMLADFLQPSIWSTKFDDFILVPLPLSGRRLRWRGFNQAEVLVKVLSEKLSMKSENILLRRVHTKTQKDLNREERKANILGSFSLKEGADVRGKNYIIVDDVVTTGATLMEACKVLKRRGASQVWCVTVARD